MAKPSQSQRAERIRDYVLFAIAVECEKLGEIVDDLKCGVINSEPLPAIVHAVPNIRKQAYGQLAYIRQAIEDLESL